MISLKIMFLNQIETPTSITFSPPTSRTPSPDGKSIADISYMQLSFFDILVVQ